MKCILRAELYKLSRSKLLWFLVLGNLAFFMAFWVKSGIEKVDIVQFWSETGFLTSASVLVALYSLVISQEYVSGYFKETVCAGYTRWQIYIARYFAFLVGTMIILILPYLSNFFLFVWKSNDAVLFIDCVRTSLSGFVFLFLYCICLSAFFMMTAVGMKSYAAVIFTCIFYNMAIVFVHEIIPRDVLPVWVSYSFIGVTDRLLDAGKTGTENIRLISTLLGQGVLYTSIGYLFWSKRELR